MVGATWGNPPDLGAFIGTFALNRSKKAFLVSQMSRLRELGVDFSTINIEALCAAPLKTLAQITPEPNATELFSCAPISAKRELRKGGGGGSGDVARRVRTNWAPEG